MESLTSEAALSQAETRPSHDNKWKRLACNYRVIEFAISICMYGFALFFATIQVAQRTESLGLVCSGSKNLERVVLMQFFLSLSLSLSCVCVLEYR